jgi:hypothetical protein
MPFSITPTTAEHIIGAVDATLQQPDGASDTFVAGFLDVPVDSARNALVMAEQLKIIRQNNQLYSAINPYAHYLVTSNIHQKAAILRLILEQYLPYKAFKHRLTITESTNEAVNQVKAIYSISTHREEVLSTFLSLGTYTNSLIGESAGRYRVSEPLDDGFFNIVTEVVQDREQAEFIIRTNLGRNASEWIDYQDVFTPLVTAYQNLDSVKNDPRAPIVNAANALESFLTQYANHHGVNISGATGINAKADKLSTARHLTVKHKNMVKYLGHVRNAADHGIDAAIGQMWDISTRTSIEYVHVAQSVIIDLVASLNNDYIV